MNNNLFSKEYLDFVKHSKIKNLTNNQHKFVEFLLIEENAKIISQIGHFDDLFIEVRKYLKNK